MLSDSPAWMNCFVIAIIVYLLQLFPFPGILFLTVGGPYWSVILINLGFLLIGFDVVRGRLSFPWLIAPGLWFVAYYVAVGFSYSQLKQLEAEIAAFNVGKFVGFDPAVNDLVFEGLPDVPRRLLMAYEIPQAAMSTPGKSDCAPYLLHRLGTACAKGAGTLGKTANGCSIITNRIRHPETGQLMNGVCLVMTSVQSTRPAVRVIDRHRQAITTDFLVGEIRTFEVIGPKGESTQVKWGVLRPLALFPLPVAGCTLISADPSWKCFAAFQKGGPYLAGAEIGSQGDVSDIVAKVLSLKSAPIAQLYPQ